MQNHICWYDEKGEGYFMSPSFGGSDHFGCPSEDKFIMTSGTAKEKQFEDCVGVYDKSDGFETEASIDCLDKPWVSIMPSMDNKDETQVAGCHHSDRKCELVNSDPYHFSVPLCKFCAGAGAFYGSDPLGCNCHSLKDMGLNDSELKVVGNIPNDCNSDMKDLILNETDDYGNGEVNGKPHELAAPADAENVNDDELNMPATNEDEYEVFNLRIIHRKNRTGFEEHKDLPIVLNTVVGGRYYVTEYLGSAAFSKVVQAHDLHTGMDVCLKIIKNDKDFFDQSLDEIKLLKLVNKHDPADERHILRLYDYFYYQEHLIIVCELLRANLYEFQKFNQESGGEAYFSTRRLQVITRQCLEALQYLHDLGVIHCDLKPENILMKSYRRCQIKVIDLGSSCFESDNLCLYVQSRSYRAPEVILGLPYDQKIDLWSLGCILAELCSGEVLFPNDVIVMILARMIGMLGPIDSEMLVMGQETHKYFTNEYDLYHMNEETKQLEYIIPEESSLEHHLQVTDDELINFLRTLLEINPQRRPTASEALEHPWLSRT
ncbi:serine/threonine-protein kinase ppk15 isoform X2 [Tripterygium wilfordii]|nr:serine/threonine-protein kinase ppk15 isoform X2 [Tripterygium wilfordii]